MNVAQPEPPAAAATDARGHAVYFYERDDDLADQVGAFIGTGLLAGEPAIVIATEAHRELFVRRWRAMNIDVEAARVAGQLTILDAGATLARIMVDDLPAADLFRRIIGSAVGSACTRSGRTVKARAYGEMVDLLWQADKQRAALALDEMWNELSDSYPFELLFAYSTTSFANAAEDAVRSDSATAPVAHTRALAAEIAYRRRVEQLLRESVRELRRARTIERDRATRSERRAEELTDAIRINELFMGVLAHDLRAPLAAIITAAQLMKMREGSAADGRNGKALNRMLASGERMSRMIEQLLDFTRLRVGGGIDIEPKSADLATLVQQAVDELEGAYPDCTVDVRRTGDTVGSWDPDRLGQVFSNLIANACQHGLPAAGVRVLIDGTAPDEVRVQVHNLGAIPAGVIGQVFEPLTGGQRRRDRSRGLGLGLFITKSIAAGHDGDVAVSSSEAAGTTFTVTLPRFTHVPADATLSTRVTAGCEQTASPPASSINLANLAQDQLRESEARFRLLVDAVKDYAIFMLDPNGRVMTWNAGAQRIKGYEAREIIGHHFSEFYEEEEVRAGKCERELEGAARDGRFEDEGWRLRKDGTKFWANVVITALRDETGELVGFAKVTRDLTERRRLELEQLRLGKAEEAIRLRDEFLSLAAHELKTPLTVLQLQLDTLGDRMETSGQRVATKLQRAAQSSERLANLVESLLDVSRIATGRFQLAIKEFDIVECVSHVVESLRLAAERSRCELSFEAEGAIVGAWDRLRLEQALTNLLGNAVKYGAGKPVQVFVRAHGDSVVLEVRDHGPGIPTTELVRIFQRFERAASIRNYGGLGLGLYLIQAIVEAHGGSVTADNAPDGGARFQLTLPLRAVVDISDAPADTVDVN